MHIETLKVFCDVVETGSFSVAASQNFITQSAVSQQLRALEAKYRCRLLERGRGGAKPTSAGEILYQGSRAILEAYRAVDTQLQELGKVVSGALRVSIVYSVGLHELPPYLKDYLRAYPQVNVHVEYSRANKIYESVINGMTDLGIVAYPSRHPQITVLPFRDDRLVLVCPPDHAFAGLRKVALSKLHRQPFISYERDIPTRRAIDHLFKTHGVTPDHAPEYDNIETIKRAVEIGQGLAIVPLPAVQREIELGTLRVVPLVDLTLMRPLGIIHKRGRHLSPAARKFIDLLRQERTDAAA